MAYAFDTLAYSKRLRASGFSAQQADGAAEAAREFVMAELVTKSDLNTAIEAQTLRLTVRLGSLVGAGVAALAVLIALT